MIIIVLYIYIYIYILLMTAIKSSTITIIKIINVMVMTTRTLRTKHTLNPKPFGRRGRPAKAPGSKPGEPGGQEVILRQNFPNLLLKEYTLDLIRVPMII